MSAWRDNQKEGAPFPRNPRVSRRQNNKMAIQHLLDEVFEEELLPREFLAQHKRGKKENLTEWDEA